MKSKRDSSWKLPEYWRCPDCDAVREIPLALDFGEYLDCEECDEVTQPHRYPATHEEFWLSMQDLKK
jgi:uncharacterized paraquat-inducible protein A